MLRAEFSFMRHLKHAEDQTYIYVYSIFFFDFVVFFITCVCVYGSASSEGSFITRWWFPGVSQYGHTLVWRWLDWRCASSSLLSPCFVPFSDFHFLFPTQVQGIRGRQLEPITFLFNFTAGRKESIAVVATDYLPPGSSYRWWVENVGNKDGTFHFKIHSKLGKFPVLVFRYLPSDNGLGTKCSRQLQKCIPERFWKNPFSLLAFFFLGLWMREWQVQ